MKIEPKTENEILEADLLQPGVYDFEVIRAVEGPSKAGNEMITLTHKVFSGSETYFVRDWLLNNDHKKLRGFAACVGILAHYDAGMMVAEDCVGRIGQCKIKVENSEKFGMGNKVAAYMPSTEGIAAEVKARLEEQASSVASTPAFDPDSDDLPF